MALAPGTRVGPPPRLRPQRSALPPQRLTLPMLAVAWRAMNLRGAPPPVFQAPLEPGVAGLQAWDSRNVFLSPQTVTGLRSLGFPGHRNLDALRVLAHEFAHAGQPRVLPSQRYREGGADAYALDRLPDLLRALGVAPTRGDRAAGVGYPEFSRWMLRRPGQRFRNAQFGR